ncbi:MAG TPA: sigma factor [Rubrobacter sp.]
MSQEVWIRVCRNIRNFRRENAITTWLCSIATNMCLGLRRNRPRRNERERGEDGTLLLAEPSGGDADPEAATPNPERSREIGAALEHTWADHRAALVLRHMVRLSYADIS